MKDITFFSKESELYDGTSYEFFMILKMESYCFGYRYVEYNGKHYYMVYHS